MSATTRLASYALSGSACLLVACTNASSDTDDDPLPTNPLVLQAYGGPPGATAVAVVDTEDGVGLVETCNPANVVGACTFTSCQTGGVGSPSPGYGDFGPISASAGSSTVHLTYNFEAYGAQGFPSSVGLATGDAIEFQGGDGARAPAFDVTAVIPDLAVMTAPATPGGVATIDSAQTLSVTWPAISSGQITFELAGLDGHAATAASITCAFDGSAGSGVVAASLLASLKASGVAPIYGTFDAQLETTTVIEEGFTVTTRSVQLSSLSDTGAFSATLQ